MNFGPFRQINIFPNLFLVVFLCAAPPLFAQNEAGSLRGLVTDPSGASVSNATVLLTTPTGDSMQTVTNKDGIYNFSALVPGVYSLKVVAVGFTIFTKDKFEISGGKGLTVNALLSIEQQEQKVEVTDSSTQVNIDPASNAGAIVITGKDLEALSDDPDE